MAQKGRPRIEIDQTAFEKLCALQCTELEICSFFECDHFTILRWCKRTYHQTFEEIAKEKRKRGLISLRRAQWKMAEKNPTMAIFLGKNYLGQTDHPELLMMQEMRGDDGFLGALQAFAENGQIEDDSDMIAREHDENSGV